MATMFAPDQILKTAGADLLKDLDLTDDELLYLLDLAAEVKADYALGQRVGIEHTPTIWVVTANSKGAPFVEVLDRSKLYQLIDQALADTKSASSAPAPKRPTSK